ncbi:MAG: hypothetical protein EU550_01690 [Promethearchaeota archaeon]|nr:MAG: hypothetical protein EU550_01690 [Candidatus Lokiarchaeota archaeon]
MTNMEKDSDLEKAWEYYKKIDKSLNGLFEILNMSIEKENIFYQCAIDNLESLKEVIIDLLKKDYDSKEIQTKLREIEFDIKKTLFFENEKE